MIPMTDPEASLELVIDIMFKGVAETSVVDRGMVINRLFNKQDSYGEREYPPHHVSRLLQLASNKHISYIRVMITRRQYGTLFRNIKGIEDLCGITKPIWSEKWDKETA